MHVIPMIITCMLQGTLCDTGIPCTFYWENICSVITACLIGHRDAKPFWMCETVHEKENIPLNPMCIKSCEFRGSYSVTCLRIWMF